MDRLRNIDFRGLLNFSKDPDRLEEQGIASHGATKRFKTQDDDVQRNTIARSLQTFFLFIALCINIALGVFQSKNKVGPSALTILNYVILIQCLLHSIALLAIPLLHDRASFLKGFYRSVNQIRFGFVVCATQCFLLLLFALINTISANVKGCKDPAMDPHADQEGYTDKLGGFCRNKRALTAFFYFALFAWLVSLFFVFQQWREYRKGGGAIPPFRESDHAEEGEDVFDTRHDARYEAPEMSAVYGQEAGRASGTFYSSDRPFADAPPTGYGSYNSPTGANPFQDPSPPYQDPYDRIRAELHMNGGQAPQLPPLQH